jgi:hypothetical protein
MTTWREVVKKNSKPGQSLKEAMKAASKEWKEMKANGTAGVAISKVPAKAVKVGKRTRKVMSATGDKKACLGSGGSTWRDVVKKNSAPGKSLKEAMKAASKEWKEMKRNGTACTGTVKRASSGKRKRKMKQRGGEDEPVVPVVPNETDAIDENVVPVVPNETNVTNVNNETEGGGKRRRKSRGSRKSKGRKSKGRKSRGTRRRTRSRGRKRNRK